MALAQVLLYSSGYDMCRYCSLLDTMYQYRFFFNRALSRSSAHWKEGANEYAIFIEQFLSLLYMGLKTVRPRKKQKSPPAGQKPTKRARIEALVLDSAEPISKADICAALPDISPTTIEAVLGTLVKAGAIQRIGAARASRYIRT